ncbi:MAG: hypothetical protein JO102_05190 [Elusimicrobia bacterium]|nr:hypothetical protein [Elusimicrobiota bacterium]
MKQRRSSRKASHRRSDFPWTPVLRRLREHRRRALLSGHSFLPAARRARS